MSLPYRAIVPLLAAAACGFTGKASTDAGGDPTGDGTPTADAPIPWLDGWTHRRAITIRASSVDADPTGPHVDFPVMIALDEEQLGTIALPDRSDLAFTLADAQTRLDHEIEIDDADDVIAWVELPSLGATADTTIFLYYGNQLPPANDGRAAWSNAYRAVYHLNQSPDQPTPGAIFDSAGELHATAEASLSASSLVDARAGRGIEFDGSAGCLTIPTVALGDELTISVWSKLDDVDQIRTVVANSQDGSDTNGFRFFLNTNMSNDRRIHFETGNGDTSASASTATGAFAHGAWVHLAVVVDRLASSAAIYVDGKLANADDMGIRPDFSTESTIEVARMKTNNEYDGILDQLEIATTKRTAAWLRTAAVNQGTPDAFYTIAADPETR